jgi:hypothetical protein
MNSYFSAPLWNEQHQAPHTVKRAKACEPEKVSKAKVIFIKEAKYRGALLSGTFVLGEKNGLSFPSNGWQVVEIYCRWFGVRLKTRGLNFKVNMDSAEVNPSYSGVVSSNISI